MNPLKKLAGQTVIYGLSSIVPKFLSYFLTPLYAYTMLPAEYGIIGDLYSLAVILNIIVTYGMETAFFWFNKNEKDNSKVFSTSFISLLISSIVFVVVVFVYRFNIARILDYPLNPEYIWWLGGIIGIDAVCAIPFVRLRLENNAFRFAFLKIGNVLITIVFNILYLVVFPKLVEKGFSFPKFVYNTDIGIGYVFISNIIASAFTLLTLLVYLRFKIVFDFKLLKRMLFYALPLLIAGLAGGFNDAIDRQFIKYASPIGLIGLEQLGIYFGNAKIAVILVVFIQMFRFSAEPFFFNYEKEKDSKQIFADIMKYFAIFCFVILLVTVANLDWIKYFLDSPYWSGLHVVPIILLANVFVGIYLNLSIWYKLSGKTLYGAYIIVIGSALTIFLNYWLVPLFGYTASAYIRLVCYVVMVIMCFYLGQKYYPIPYQTLAIAKYFGISLILFFLFIFFNNINVIVKLLLFNLAILLFIGFVLKKENLIPVIMKLIKRK